MGEDVFNQSSHGADTEGTRLAAKEGPAALVMPADLEGGDGSRPEHIPALVFEKVTVTNATKAAVS